jgi:hypothetical protein
MYNIKGIGLQLPTQHLTVHHVLAASQRDDVDLVFLYGF